MKSNVWIHWARLFHWSIRCLYAINLLQFPSSETMSLFSVLALGVFMQSAESFLWCLCLCFIFGVLTVASVLNWKLGSFILRGANSVSDDFNRHNAWQYGLHFFQDCVSIQIRILWACWWFFCIGYGTARLEYRASISYDFFFHGNNCFWYCMSLVLWNKLFAFGCLSSIFFFIPSLKKLSIIISEEWRCNLCFLIPQC